MVGADVACPGCGVVLPRDAAAAEPSAGASSECAAVFAEISGFEFQHPVMLRFHQMSVDAYGAQHAGPDVPLIRTASALAGLWLALEQDFSGDEVRAVHQRMGKPADDWPRFEPGPPPCGWPTVVDVADAGVRAASEAEHARAVRRWAESVWSAWQRAEPGVDRLVRDLLRRLLVDADPRRSALHAVNGPAGAVHRLVETLRAD